MVTPPARPSVTATDHRWRPHLALTLGLLLISGCQSTPQPKPDLSVSTSSCLEDLASNQLRSALQRCNSSVEAFPNQPEPWRDRSLVQTLLGQHNQACRDVEQAIALMDDRADPMLRHELTVRQATCKPRPTNTGTD
jgi:Tfp pilus assembly protein PilF